MEMKSKVAKSKLLNDYHDWLCNIINVNQVDKCYWLLAKALDSKPFFWSVPNDDNRAFEGKNLRERFCDDMGIIYDSDDFSETASMLEVILGLAYRCEAIMADLDSSLTVVEWFWKIIKNIGLDICTDDYFSNYGVADFVESTLNKVIDRSYQRNGKGGLFPLRNAKKDQRKLELWYQMSAYLIENYYTEEAIV